MKSAYFCKDSLLKSGELTKTLFTSISEGSFSRPKGRKFSSVREKIFSLAQPVRGGVLSSSTLVKFVELSTYSETVNRNQEKTTLWVIWSFGH